MRNEGHCPCNKEKTPDTLCPCIDLVEKEICHCNLFVAKEEENNNVVN
jgi:ferredoxin-thioredoxin reductase catalytic subunit